MAHCSGPYPCIYCKVESAQRVCAPLCSPGKSALLFTGGAGPGRAGLHWLWRIRRSGQLHVLPAAVHSLRRSGPTSIRLHSALPRCPVSAWPVFTGLVLSSVGQQSTAPNPMTMHLQCMALACCPSTTWHSADLCSMMLQPKLVMCTACYKRTLPVAVTLYPFRAYDP